MTFNHASYINDAMNGFCMQQTNFPFVAAAGVHAPRGKDPV